MIIIRNVILSTKEPVDKHVLWIKPVNENTYNLFFFLNNGWHPIGETSSDTCQNIDFKYIKSIPDINI